MSHDEDHESQRNRSFQTPLRGGDPLATPSRLTTTPRIFQQQPVAARRPLAFEDESQQQQQQQQYDQQSIYFQAYTGSASLASSSFAEDGLVRPSTVQTPTRFRRPIDIRSAPPKPRAASATPQQQQSARRPPASAVHHSPLVHKRNTKSGKPTKKNLAKLRKIRYSNHPRRQQQQKQQSTQRAFQQDANFPRLFVQTISLTQRSAFEPRPLVSLDDWTRLAASSSPDDSQQPPSRLKSHRMSPSYPHLQFLHAQSRQTRLRQLQFSPSVGQDADALVDWYDVDTSPEYDGVNDGRYRSIDPLATTLAALPTSGVPPVLAFGKTRLPMRSDVGFANATAEEIQCKQQEIQHETEWEETSPRLALMIPSNDYGTMVRVDSGDSDNDDHGSGSQPVTCPEHLEWNGGGLPGMPFAGRELLQAMERNAKYFRRPSLTHLRPYMGANPYSMLAPPLDASYSPSQGWRPRPYHDRPPGMKYLLACPMEVSFFVGDIEPLVCSLALYSLPPLGTVEKSDAYGKISEEFWFPAGNWDSDKVHFDGAKREDGSIDEDILEAWIRRKRKAIFSYDPLDLWGGLDSCCLVLHVHQLVRRDGMEPYAQDKNSNFASNTVESPGAFRSHADRVFERHGSRLLSPLCFGIVKLIPKGLEESEPRLAWPFGETLDLDLYHYKGPTESQESFVKLLASLALREHGAEHDHDDSLSASRQANGAEPIAPSVQWTEKTTATSYSTRGKATKVSVTRLFRSKTTTYHADDDHGRSSKGVTTSIHTSKLGSAKLFVSNLPTDFLQCMLASPMEVDPSPQQNNIVETLPRLLVDVSGDCAVLLDPGLRNDEKVHESSGHKRSSLLRLPFPKEQQSIYTAAAEYQELLFLRPRPDKHYDVDCVPYRSPLNLLYLYPRLLHGDKAPVASRFTLRIRLKHAQTNPSNEPENAVIGSAIRSIFNPAPWTGPALMDEIYTRVQPNDSDALKKGIFFRDEIKLRLPELLDGTHYLEITLFAVDVTLDVAELKQLAAVSIPLSTSSSRGFDMNDRVATIIPNGNHRLKLGAFQLQLESRLISNFHVGDPAMASVLRKLPLHSQSLHSQDNLNPANSSGVNVSQTEEMEGMFFSKISGATLTAHFTKLLSMIAANSFTLSNTSSIDQPQIVRSKIDVMVEMLRQVKLRFLEYSPRHRRHRIAAFLKAQIDGFEEAFPGVKALDSNGLDDPKSLDSDERICFQPSNSGDESENIDPDDMEKKRRHKTARRLRRSMRLSSRHEIRISRIVDNLGAAGRTFSRVSYGGASKIDHMLLQSENGLDHGNFAMYFEDDETVFTAPASKSLLGSETMDPKDFVLNTVRSPQASHSDNSIVRSGTASSDEHLHTNGGQEFAQRVRSVAQIMLAPCGVGPSSFAPSSGAPAPLLRKIHFAHGVFDTVDEKTDLSNCQPGSDDDASTKSVDHSTSSNSHQSHDVAEFQLRCSIEDVKDPSKACAASCKYIYELIVVHCLQSWAEHEGNSHNACPAYDDLICFHRHLDFFLPLCLKSFSLRYHSEIAQSGQPVAPAVLDENHMLILCPFVEILAKDLFGQVFSGRGVGEENQRSLLSALFSSQVVIDFLVGISAIIHPEQVKELLESYIGELRRCEIDGHTTTAENFEWTEEYIHRVRCSRMLRMRVFEAFAALPYFMALNFPSKFAKHSEQEKVASASWTRQILDKEPKGLLSNSGKGHSHDERLPHSGWLAKLLIDEALSICASSSEIVVAEALTMTHEAAGSSKFTIPVNRPGAALTGSDLLMFQSIAVHAVTCVYELIVRRHSMDKRYQSDVSYERVAGVIAPPILERSIAAVQWLARMDSRHKVRVLWMLSLIYTLQEAPESFISSFIRDLCNPSVLDIHRFIRLLRLCSATFQCLLDAPAGEKEYSDTMTPWLVQETFNTICATAITLVDDCANIATALPTEQGRMTAGILDLLLHILTMPQSPVTQLRAVGGALQVLERFGVELFLESTGQDLQHWLRIILSLMNSTSLSVRSISVDFFVSLLGSTYDFFGCVDDLTLIVATVLPEVVAREIALFSVAGLINNSEDVFKCLWPLRRSIADLEDIDERIDAQLLPMLSVFCRVCQAIIDGVLLELSLQGEDTFIAGTKVNMTCDTVFDADEESLLEVASFFSSEIAPIQRVRWLWTLNSLHEHKHQWIEAGETLVLCASTLVASLPFLKSVWRPSSYEHWSDMNTSPWLRLLGACSKDSDCGTVQVMDFAQHFLEPTHLVDRKGAFVVKGKLPQLTVKNISELLIIVSKKAINYFCRTDRLEEHTYARLEEMLSSLTDARQRLQARARDVRSGSGGARKRQMDDDVALRKAIMTVSSEMTKLAEVINIMNQEGPSQLELSTAVPPSISLPGKGRTKPAQTTRPKYVVARITGKKPPRFSESTGIPAFFEFAVPYICRLQDSVLDEALGIQLPGSQDLLSEVPLLRRFAQPFLTALSKECAQESVVLKTEPWADYYEEEFDETKTYFHVFPVEEVDTEGSNGSGLLSSKVFFYRQLVKSDNYQPTVVEMKVGKPFPGPLSRQRVLVTTEITATPFS